MSFVPSNSAVTVLIVDQRADVARAIARSIDTPGISVMIAGSAAQAHSIMISVPPDLTIVGLEGLDGLRFLKEIVGAKRTRHLIVHTKNLSSMTASWAAQDKTIELVETTTAHQSLIDAVRRLLGYEDSRTASNGTTESTPGPASIELPLSDHQLSAGERISSIVAPPSSGLALVGKTGIFPSLPDLEQHVITEVFRECQGNLSMAARTLGIPRSTLRDRLKKFGITLSPSSKKTAI